MSVSKERFCAYATAVLLFLTNLMSFCDRSALNGLLQLAYIGVSMLFCPIYGYIGDRYSRRWPLIIGIVIWIAAVLTSTFIPPSHSTFWWFLLCRAFAGIGEASWATYCGSLIADLFSGSTRSFIFMVYYIAIPSGSGLGYAVGGSLSAKYGWQWAMRLAPLVTIILLFGFVVFMPEAKQGESEMATNESAAKESLKSDFVSLCTNATYVFVCLAQIAQAFYTGGTGFWTPTILVYSRLTQGLSGDKERIPVVLGFLGIFAGFIGTVTGIIFAFLWRKVNPRADALVCAIAMMSTGCIEFICITSFYYNETVGFASYGLSVITLSMMWPVSADLTMYVVAPERRSLASAIQVSALHLLGDGPSPYIMGQIATTLMSSNSNFDNYISLRRTFYGVYVIAILSGAFYLAAALFVEKDRSRILLEIKASKNHLISTVPINIAITGTATMQKKDNIDNYVVSKL